MKRRATVPFTSLNLWVAVLVQIFLGSETLFAVGGFSDIWLKAEYRVRESRTKSALHRHPHKEMACDGGA